MEGGAMNDAGRPMEGGAINDAGRLMEGGAGADNWDEEYREDRGMDPTDDIWVREVKDCLSD